MRDSKRDNHKARLPAAIFYTWRMCSHARIAEDLSRKICKPLVGTWSAPIGSGHIQQSLLLRLQLRSVWGMDSNKFVVFDWGLGTFHSSHSWRNFWFSLVARFSFNILSSSSQKDSIKLNSKDGLGRSIKITRRCVVGQVLSRIKMLIKTKVPMSF